MSKPVVKIKNFSITDEHGYWHLKGEVQDHPRFQKGQVVQTSQILRIETKNTIYELEE